MPLIREISTQEAWIETGSGPGGPRITQDGVMSHGLMTTSANSKQYSMRREARTATDEAECIVRNIHFAVVTGAQQPCDLSPVF